MRVFTFEKEEDGRWFVVLPEWEYDKDALEMVAGADTLLDIISQGENRVSVAWHEEEPESWKYKLTFLREDEEFSGAWYAIEGSNVTPFECWLCPVTVFVFGYYPKQMFLI
jgi:hypothetical protein